jgi:hypothetical protein
VADDCGVSSLYVHTIHIRGLRPLFWLSVCLFLTFTSATAVPLTVRLINSSLDRDFPVNGLVEDPVSVECFGGGAVIRATIPVGASSVTVDVPSTSPLIECFGSPRPGFKRSRRGSRADPYPAYPCTVSIPYTYASGSINFTFRDRSGQLYIPPVGRISCKSLGTGEDSYAFKTLPARSSMRVPFEPGSYRCEVSIPGATSAPQHQLVSVMAGQTSEVSYTSPSEDSDIEFSLFDPSGSPFQDLTNPPSQISCATNAGPSPMLFSRDIPPSGSGYLRVVGGYSYACSVVSPRGDLLWSKLSVAVDIASSALVSFTSSPKAATINVKLVDSLGQAVTPSPELPSPKVLCRDLDQQAEDTRVSLPIGSSEVSVPVDVGRYACVIENLRGYHSLTSPSQGVLTQPGLPQDYPIVLIRNTATLRVGFTTRSGTPIAVPSLSTSARVDCRHGEERVGSSLKPWATSAILSLAGEGTYDCIVSGFAGYAEGIGSITVGAGELRQLPIDLREKSGRVTVSKWPSAGYFLSDPYTPFFEARSTTNSLFTTSLPGVDYGNSATMDVVDSESYTCAVADPGGITSTATVFVGPNGSASADLTVLHGDSTLHLRLIESVGNVLTDVRNAFVELEALSDGVRHTRPVVFKDGIASLAIKSGVSYKVRLKSSDNESEPFLNRHGGGSYYVKNAEASFLARAGELVSKDFLVAPPSASIEVFSSRNRGQVTIRPASFSGAGKLSGLVRKNLGEHGAHFELPEDVYEVLFHDAGASIAQKRIVSLRAGDAIGITFEEPREDRIIKVSAIDLAPISGPLTCNAYSRSGGATQEQRGVIGGAPLYIPVSSQSSQWEVFCRGWDEVAAIPLVGRGSYSFADITNSNEIGVVEIALQREGSLLQATSVAQASSVIRLSIPGVVEVAAPIGAFAWKETVRLSVTEAASAPATEAVEPTQVLRFSATTARLEPLLSQEPISARVSLVSNYSIYGYSKRRGYFPLYQATDSGTPPVAVDVVIPADIFNEGVLVVGTSPTRNSNRGPIAAPTPSPTAPTTPSAPTPPSQPIPSGYNARPLPPTQLQAQSLKTFVKAKRTLLLTWVPSQGSVDSFTVRLERNGSVVRRSSVSARSNPTARFGHISPGKYVVRVASISGASTSPWISKSVRVR